MTEIETDLRQHDSDDKGRVDKEEEPVGEDLEDLADSVTTLDATYHPLDDSQPHQYSMKIKRRQRILHALKVGLGVLLASQLVLIEAIDDAFGGNGVWAVITVVVVTLQTPGETTQKIINRTTGTVIGAALALMVGTLAGKLSQVLYPAGHIMLTAANFVGAATGAFLATRGGTWSYAFLLGTITYVFITLSVFVDGVSVAFSRAFMIAVGGIIGFLVSWLPPHVRASDVARAYLADALLDAAGCAELAVHNFLTGRPLNPIHEIYSGEDDDSFHKLSKMIQVSRVPLEAAISASSYEAAGQLGKTFRTSGLAVRLALRTLLSADALLRQEYDPLDQSNCGCDERLAIALTNVASCIRVELAKKVLDLHCSLPEGFDQCAEISLPVALVELQSCLQAYVQESSTLEGDINENVMSKFACHVSFVRLIYDTGRYIVDVSSTVVPPEAQGSFMFSMELAI